MAHTVKHLRFNIKDTPETLDAMSILYTKYNMDDLVVVKPAVDSSMASREGWLCCYGTRKNGAKFKLPNGAKSMAKKIKMLPTDLSIVHLTRNTRMPKQFFQMLDTDRLDEQIVAAYGKFSDKMLVKAHIQAEITQNNNKHVNQRILEAGVETAMDEGTLSLGQLKAAEAWTAKKADIQQKQLQTAKNLNDGDTINFNCHVTGKRYPITIVGLPAITPDNPSAEVVINQETGLTEIHTQRKTPFVKKKHYYFYSSNPGYGKTDLVDTIVEHCNATVVGDVNNWTNVREDAQLIILDEYGATSRIPMLTLRGLTSGRASGTEGNRKSYGGSYRPRPDAQFIIMSNYHLFESMGTWDAKKCRRVVSAGDAKILLDRFHIIKLDEAVSTSEEEDRQTFTAITDAQIATSDDDQVFTLLHSLAGMDVHSRCVTLVANCKMLTDRADDIFGGDTEALLTSFMGVDALKALMVNTHVKKTVTALKTPEEFPEILRKAAKCKL